MKKLKYIQPQTTVVRMQTVHMIAASNEITGDANNTELNSETMDEGSGGDAASRRRRSDWDDGDEDW